VNFKKKTHLRVIPNALTLGNLLSGFLAINAIMNNKIEVAIILLFIAIMLDAMDGRVARILGVPGEFGKELDSLADIVSFGVAPALLALEVFYGNSMIELFLIGLFPVMGAYRLARFNLMSVEESSKNFKGIPITLAGAIVVLMVLFEQSIVIEWFTIVYVLLMFLMVSTIKIPSFKKIEMPRNIIITFLFLIYTGVVFVQPTNETMPMPYYAALLIYIGFITVRFFKEKEPKFKRRTYKGIKLIKIKRKKV
jgi:CDP-diacylglycerol---serine O-phosphatidyltransferase